jgi:hypothetical protein
MEVEPVKTLLTLLTVTLLFSAPSHAKTAKELRNACAPNTDNKQAVELLAMNCAGYIEAIADNISVTDIESAGQRLVPTLNEEYTLGQLKDAFLLYMSQHPEEEQHTASAVLFQAWNEHKMVKLVPQPRQKPSGKESKKE